MIDIIRTQRLELRPFSDEDAGALAQLLNGEIKKTYMIPDFEDAAALEKMVRSFIGLSRVEERFVRGIYLQERLIGFVNDVGIENGCIELGYALHPACWNKGYATEMLRAVLAALPGGGFTAVKAGAFCENTASLRVMEKCGMQKCPQTESIFYRGEEHRCVYCEINI